MAQSDDIDKLLREVQAMTGPGPSGGQPPAALPAAQPPAVPATRSRGARLAWTGVGAVGGLATGGVVGTLLAVLPWVSTISTAVGAALGGAVVGFVSGPPGWFDRS